MSRIVVLCICVALLAVPSRMQNVNPAHPENMEVQHVPTAEEVRARVSNAQVQKDIKELGELGNQVHSDMEGLQQGMLGKEVVERLRRLEKLSKRVREQLTR
jgi:hypothetical protein